LPRSSTCKSRSAGLIVAAAALLALSLGSCGQTGPGPNAVRGPVRFYREFVIVEVAEGRTSVEGRYYFRNASDDSVEASMSYPFPVDAHHSPPTNIELFRVEGDTLWPMGFRQRQDHIIWRMRMTPRGEQQALVRYSQRTPRGRAKYIVTTTRLWDEPIELAEFEFRVPVTLRGVQTSFEPETVATRNDTVFYRVSWTGFMPDQDLEVRWE